MDPFGDADKDGKLNMFDCRPFNRKRHGKFSNKPYLSGNIIEEEITPVMKSYGSTSIEKLKRKTNVSAFIIPSGDIVDVGTDQHSDFVDSGWQDKTKSVRLRIPKYEVSINVSAKQFTPEQLQTIRELAKDKDINYDIDPTKPLKEREWGIHKTFDQFEKEISKHLNEKEALNDNIVDKEGGIK